MRLAPTRTSGQIVPVETSQPPLMRARDGSSRRLPCNRLISHIVGPPRSPLSTWMNPPSSSASPGWRLWSTGLGLGSGGKSDSKVCDRTLAASDRGRGAVWTSPEQWRSVFRRPSIPILRSNRWASHFALGVLIHGRTVNRSRRPTDRRDRRRGSSEIWRRHRWPAQSSRMEYLAMRKSILLKVSFVLALVFSPVDAFAQCKGYSGPGGPCYTGPGGGLYTGPGGGAYTGPGGGAYTGPGGGAYTGPGGGAYTGPGGGAYTGPGGGAYTGPGGGAYTGPGGGAYSGPGGPCYSGPGSKNPDPWNRPSPNCK